MPADPLAALQQQFYAAVVDGAPAPALTSGDVAVYAHMYWARLRGVLADDHAVLRAALGADRFDALVDGYLRAHPPTSFTLRDLGVGFAAHLTAVDAPPWAADLARLERARVEVFDAVDQAVLTRADVAVRLPDTIGELPLRWVAAAEVVPVAWDVAALWDAPATSTARPGARPDATAIATPVAAPGALLVWRRGVDVYHRALEPDEAALAPRLAAGATFADVCAAVDADDPAARAIELLVRWIDDELLVAAPA